MSHWRIASRRLIARALLEYEAQQACLGEPLVIKDALRHISRAYPFGERKRHPYKQWLKEVGLARRFLQTNRPAIEFQHWATAESKRRKSTVAPGQITLFDDHARD